MADEPGVEASPPSAVERLASEAIAIRDVSMAVVLDTVVGYRAQCLERGFSVASAERMAVAFHAVLLQRMFPGSYPGS